MTVKQVSGQETAPRGFRQMPHTLLRFGGGRALRWLAVLYLALLASAGPAASQCPLTRAAELPITLWRNKLYVPVSVNGSPRLFFVDTGAAVTSISEKTAADLTIPHDFDHTMDTIGVGGEESHLYIGHVHNFSIGGITLADRAFAVAAFGEPMADGEHHPDGLIGADILSHFDVEIDILRRRITLWQAKGCSDVKPNWDGPVEGVHLSIDPSHHISVPVQIDDARLNLFLDTGATSLVLSTRAAAQAGATPEILEQNPLVSGFGVNDRRFPAHFHIFRRLAVGRDVYGDVPAVVVSNGRYGGFADGLLGVEFLKRGRVWISYASSMLFTQPQRLVE